VAMGYAEFADGLLRLLHHVSAWASSFVKS